MNQIHNFKLFVERACAPAVRDAARMLLADIQATARWRAGSATAADVEIMRQLSDFIEIYDLLVDTPVVRSYGG